MPDCIKFADFELDLAAYSLRGAHGPVKLEKMPMEVLILLVKRAGTLVPRSEIQSVLWGGRVNVEYGSAINTVVRKIRQALDDDAESPRFVETVVGKGYRFVAPVKSALPPSTIAAGAAAVRPVLPAAFEAYVKGRHAWNKRTQADLREAVRFFQESIDADPTYAPAFAGMAEA